MCALLSAATDNLLMCRVCVQIPDITMGLFCSMTLGIIIRRLGGVVLQIQRGNQRPFRPRFPDPLAGRKYTSLKDRRRHLEQQAKGQYSIAQNEIDETAGKTGIPGDKALIALMQAKYESAPKPTGLPDEISEMISKNQLEAAQGWFNERIPDDGVHELKLKRRQHRTGLDRTLDSIGFWTIMISFGTSMIVAYSWDGGTCELKHPTSACSDSRVFFLISCMLIVLVVLLNIRMYLKEADKQQARELGETNARMSVKAGISRFRETVGAAKKRTYVVEDEIIDELIEAIREYKAFVDRTQFNYKAKFASRFSEAGYKGVSRTQTTGRHGIYAWLGSLEGNTHAVKPIQNFLIKLDESAEEQRWATMQTFKPLYEFCLKSDDGDRNSARSPVDRFDSIGSLRDASNNPLLMGLGEDEVIGDAPEEVYVTLSGTGKHGVRLASDMTVAELEVGSVASSAPDMSEVKSKALVLRELNDVILGEGYEHAMQTIDDAWSSQDGQPECKITLVFGEKVRKTFGGAIREVVLRKDDIPHTWRRRLEFAKDRTIRACNPELEFREEDLSLQDVKEKEDDELQSVQQERLVLCAVNGESVEDLPFEQLKTKLDDHFEGPGSDLEVVLSFGTPKLQWYDHLTFATLKHSVELIVVGGTDRAGNVRTGYPKSVFFILTRLYFVGELLPRLALASIERLSC